MHGKEDIEFKNLNKEGMYELIIRDQGIILNDNELKALCDILSIHVRKGEEPFYKHAAVKK